MGRLRPPGAARVLHGQLDVERVFAPLLHVDLPAGAVSARALAAEARAAGGVERVGGGAVAGGAGRGAVARHAAEVPDRKVQRVLESDLVRRRVPGVLGEAAEVAGDSVLEEVNHRN